MNEPIMGKKTLSTEIQNLDAVAWRIHNLLFSSSGVPKEVEQLIPNGEIKIATFLVEGITKRLEEVEDELKNLK